MGLGKASSPYNVVVQKLRYEYLEHDGFHVDFSLMRGVQCIAMALDLMFIMIPNSVLSEALTSRFTFATIVAFTLAFENGCNGTIRQPRKGVWV